MQLPDPKPVLIALGGNAITPPGTTGTIDEQFAQSRKTVMPIADLIESGQGVVLTHGNGPQVGSTLRRVELAAGEVYPLPLHVCVADTQAGMGYMITQCLNNEFLQRGKNFIAATLITRVLVDWRDPGFEHADKPIGRHIEREEALRLAERFGWRMVAAPSGRFRRAVPSPRPLRILEIDVIRHCVAAGETLVVCGGGGVPVIDKPGHGYYGADAVIDKDLSSALLAAELGLETFVILTGVERVVLNYGKPDQRDLDRLSGAEARRYLDQDQFPAGSMGPKIEAAIDFLNRTPAANPRVIITDIEHLIPALQGVTGTTITREPT